MGNLTRHADPGGAVGEVRGEEVPVRSDHTRRPVVSVVEEGETAWCSPWPPGRARWSTRRGPPGRARRPRLPPAGRGRRHRGTPRRSRRGPPRGDIRNRQSVHPAYQSPTAGSCCCSPCRHSPDAHKRYSRDRSSAGTTRSASPLRAGLWSTSLCSTRTRRRRPRGGACRGRLGYRWSRSPTIRRTAAPSASQTEPSLGPGQLQDQGVLSGGVLDRGGDDIGGRRTSVQLGGGRTPAPGTLRSTRRVAQGARGVGGDRCSPERCSCGHGDQKASPAAGREPRSAPTAAQRVPHPAP